MDELLLRQMPHSTEAEQAVLGSMLIDAACVKDVMDQLQPDDFYLRQNREIFETIYTMFVYSRPIDGLTVAGELEKAGLANDGTRAYLAQLMEVTPTSANVLEYVRLVREKALLRSVAAAAAEITAMVQEGTGAPGDVLEAAAAPRASPPFRWCCRRSWSIWRSSALRGARPCRVCPPAFRRWTVRSTA